MPRSRPATSPLSYHRHTGQFYVTRGGKRVYLGTDEKEALRQFHELQLGMSPTRRRSGVVGPISAKELANRFLATQKANWRAPESTLRSYKAWIGRFLEDHPGLLAADFTVEMFASWKLSLRQRGYAAETINHFLSSVRAMFAFAADMRLLESAPPLRRVRNDSCAQVGSSAKPLYAASELRRLIEAADLQLQAMIMLALNCGFGPKDLHDLTWDDMQAERVTLPRSKTGICQTYALWPDTQAALRRVRAARACLVERLAKRGRVVRDSGYVFVTRYWRRWNKDAVTEQFRKLCVKAGVPCYGFYRLRHCASTAMSLVATPHVHRRFMRHSQLKTQVGYTHTPDDEVDAAIMKARGRLLGLEVTEGPERNPAQAATGDAASEPAQADQSGEQGTPRRQTA